MHKFCAVAIALFLLLPTSCVTLIPQPETVIRLPQEHEYISHQGRIPLIYVRTFPREHWDFVLPFRTENVNGLFMTGEALVATLESGLGTVFKTTRRAASGDFLAMVELDHFQLTYALQDDGRMEFKASLDFVIVDKVGRQVDSVSTGAITTIILPDDQTGQLRAAAGAVAELLSIMEKDLARHARKAWQEGRYADF